MNKATKTGKRKTIHVYADWEGLSEATYLGELNATKSRGKEIFSFSYHPDWLKKESHSLDPSLQLFQGPQYAPQHQENFSLFLDSSPDRWGRLLMKRREAILAREENREEHQLVESDYLLGVHDEQRMGALRFKVDQEGPFLGNGEILSSPPWSSLRELEQACLAIEKEEHCNNPNNVKWLKMLIAPGGSLGGARPKAGVLDEKKQLWIAKFPSQADEYDVAAWEMVVNRLAFQVGIYVAEARLERFNSHHHTFLSKRFDRTNTGRRIHFASAMTLLQYTDGEDASTGASYLELAELIMREGSEPKRDLAELWRRIVFNICVSNTDDHLRNHGFILTASGWELSPAFDMNPTPYGDGLKLNISETDNSQHMDLAYSVAKYFRLKPDEAKAIGNKVIDVVSNWCEEADKLKISAREQKRMSKAFRACRF